MADAWILQMQELNARLRETYSSERLGNREWRRQLLNQFVGRIRRLRRLDGPAMELARQRRPVVGIDGSSNSYGGEFPYYVELMRAIAKPSEGEPIVLKEIHCPVPPVIGVDDEAVRRDQELRQQRLADLEVRAALAAIERFSPALILMDGPLVRFYMRARESFSILCHRALEKDILLVGCIENIRSRVISSVLEDRAPASWQNGYDYDLLWGTLDFGEVLEIAVPAKGTKRREDSEAKGEEEIFPILTWFLRSSLDPGVIGIDMLESQVSEMGWVADYLFTLCPPDGRGIPIWLDLVDREARLTDVELDAYLELLDFDLRRIFVSKRGARLF